MMTHDWTVFDIFVDPEDGETKKDYRCAKCKDFLILNLGEELPVNWTCSPEDNT